LRAELNDFFLASIGAGQEHERATPRLALVN
jgi:hypothetical protein